MENVIQIKIADEQLDNIRHQLYEVAMSEIERVKNDIQGSTPYMKKCEACEYLHVSNNTLDKLIVEGLPKHKMGGVLRFDKREIDKWMAQQNNE